MNGALLQFLLGPVLDKILAFIPDPQKKAEIQLELAKLQQSEDFKALDAAIAEAQAQGAINVAEAQSSDWFKSYWRPCVGWICAGGLFFQFVFAPTVTWITTAFGKTIAFPTLDTNTLMTLLFGMLGLGAYRTIEKIKGVS